MYDAQRARAQAQRQAQVDTAQGEQVQVQDGAADDDAAGSGTIPSLCVLPPACAPDPSIRPTPALPSRLLRDSRRRRRRLLVPGHERRVCPRDVVIVRGAGGAVACGPGAGAGRADGETGGGPRVSGEEVAGARRASRGRRSPVGDGQCFGIPAVSARNETLDKRERDAAPVAASVVPLSGPAAHPSESPSRRASVSRPTRTSMPRVRETEGEGEARSEREALRRGREG
ncbi:hypothetical protein DMC30DRAFT_75054 [Rhodotorula diobovata]|uniref:Uncharacterized protein n=1 Tax=Rhodotorula diobovata TaxID=5288 RepID=A0A5C5FP08_9BASI|nr:hypothetical protein DMC30DRAFT_75054 [Rhodotorula diobovata]